MCTFMHEQYAVLSQNGQFFINFRDSATKLSSLLATATF